MQCRFLLRGDGRITHASLAHATLHDLVETDIRATTNKENIARINLHVLLVRVLAATLRRNIANRAFENLEQRLLYAFAGYVTRDRNVLGLATNLVDFVDVDNTTFGFLHIVVGRLQKTQNDIFNIFADIACLGERGGVGDRKGHLENASECASEQRLAGTSRSNQQNITLFNLDVAKLRSQRD